MVNITCTVLGVVNEPRDIGDKPVIKQGFHICAIVSLLDGKTQYCFKSVFNMTVCRYNIVKGLGVNSFDIIDNLGRYVVLKRTV